jgi:hypothetical protein
MIVFVSLILAAGCDNAEPTSLTPTQSQSEPSSLEKRYFVQADETSVPDSTTDLAIHAHLSRQRVDLRESFDLQLDVTIASTYQLYRSVSPGSPLKPLEVSAKSNSDALVVGAAVLDESSKVDGGNRVYRKQFTVKIPVTLASATDVDQCVVDIQMSYQICNDLQCLPPATISLSVPISIDLSP